MRTLNTAMSSDRLLMSGANHLTALNQTEETKSLIGAFQPAYDALQTAVAAREQAEGAMSVPRVTLRFSEKDLERVIREIALLAHTVDDNATTGPAFKALFPDGLDAEVRPLGLSQIAATMALRDRLATQPAAAKVKAQTLEKLDQGLARFKASLEARQSAEGKLSQARAVESGAREGFVKAYDSSIGAIRQLFPRDREQQDLYFDDLSTARSSAEEKGEETTSPPAPAGSGPGA